MLFYTAVLILTSSLILDLCVRCYTLGRLPSNKLHRIHSNIGSEPKMTYNLGGGQILMSCFRNKQGLLIRTYAARIKNPKASIILVHGVRSHFRADYSAYNLDWHCKHIGDSVTSKALEVSTMEFNHVFANSRLNSNETFDNQFLHGKNVLDTTPRFQYEGSFIECLNNMGFSIYALDLQSHGLSEGFSGKRCLVNKFDDFAHDVIQFIDIVKRNQFENKEEKWNPDLFTHDTVNDGNKYYLGGLSMGGNIVIRTIQLFNKYSKSKTRLVDGLLCLSGMLNIDYHFSGYLKQASFPLIRFLAKIRPHWTLILEEAGQYAETISLFMRYHDPLYHSKRLPCKMVVTLFDATKTLERDMLYYPKDLPTLVIHSTDDKTCDVKGARDFANVHFKDNDNVQLVEIDGEAHVISSPLYTPIVSPIISKWFDGLSKA
ncbi:conserved hypothetical protein [Theileria equi strain WA]|uniref:Serine aminopeptidase S33 domain-containing protein n=1 Tax=Theileria equi strain WA TaxID=1537102 RepID=L1LEC5_THEEQ|nr:conserved hypothetical protein [Theileria equi strain WA]EKX73757.1 conserved hypothetical protein [Theileria equi strain WA]|eukprot:XP_004833209.1 conserved hypothetical protein [Theileria equi strain WA]